MLSVPRHRRVPAAVVLSAAVSSLAVAGLAAAPGALAADVTNIHHSGVVTLAPGITQYKETFRTTDGYSQSAVLTLVNLAARGVTVRVQASHNAVNSDGETVLSMAARTGARAGVNGDLFDFGGTGAPYGGEIVNGKILKSPTSTRVGQFAVLDNGKAVLGPVSYAGRITRTDKAKVHKGVSINNVKAAKGGGVTMVTRNLGPSSVPRGCVITFGTKSRGAYTVTSVATQRSISILPAKAFALIGCGKGRQWLLTNAAPSSRFTLKTKAFSPAYPTATVISSIQGARMVLRHGVRYTDRSTTWRTAGHNPETFVCVNRKGTRVLLGTVDGRLYRAVGVTFRQVTSYMLAHKCYDGLVMDGGGSTTAVGATSADGPLRVRNRPAWGGEPRPLANGIFAYHKD